MHISEGPKNRKAVDPPYHDGIGKHGYVAAGSASNKICVLLAKFLQPLKLYTLTRQQFFETVYLNVLIVWITKVEQMDFKQAAPPLCWGGIE